MKGGAKVGVLPEIPKYVAGSPELTAYISLLYYFVGVLIFVVASLLGVIVFLYRSKEAKDLIGVTMSERLRRIEKKLGIDDD